MVDHRSQSETFPMGSPVGISHLDSQGLGLPQRLACLAALFAVELIAISTWIDTQALWGTGRLAMQSVIAFAALFLAIGYLRSKPHLQHISAELAGTPINWFLLTAHLVAMA